MCMLEVIIEGILINHNDIKTLSKYINKTTKEIREAKKTIFKYLTKSFSGLSYKRISDMFESVKKEYPERLYKNSTVDDIRLNLFYFASYIAEIGDSYKDYGYSLLLAYFFWITRDI